MSKAQLTCSIITNKTVSQLLNEFVNKSAIGEISLNNQQPFLCVLAPKSTVTEEVCPVLVTTNFELNTLLEKGIFEFESVQIYFLHLSVSILSTEQGNLIKQVDATQLSEFDFTLQHTPFVKDLFKTNRFDENVTKQVGQWLDGSQHHFYLVPTQESTTELVWGGKSNEL
ncbi:hypothetical protein ACSLBF_07360 [Pseudoalteromonas sp. T1lg65]|uniref:hypothetical protein n=1 Tax=Pseudoalteromonas sp. T1lg65 TaxID=2077101 RepID=UPI003F7AAABE